FLTLRLPPRATPFPYTTLFRSRRARWSVRSADAAGVPARRPAAGARRRRRRDRLLRPRRSVGRPREDRRGRPAAPEGDDRRRPREDRIVAMTGTDYRVGSGFDAHALEDGVPLVLGGVRIDHPRGLVGHSDGDVLAHALTDAVLG